MIAQSMTHRSTTLKVLAALRCRKTGDRCAKLEGHRLGFYQAQFLLVAPDPRRDGGFP
jgi:hypothetical protein